MKAMKKKPILLVLAAGMGSRYGGLKQMDPVGPAGETVLDYGVYDALRAGCGKVVFVIRRDMEKAFHAKVGRRFTDRIEVAYAIQDLDDLPPGGRRDLPDRRKPWGTGHAVLAARDKVDAPFITINADDFYGPEGYRRLVEKFETVDPASDAYAMVGFVLRNTLSDHGAVSRGICGVDARGRLVDVHETTGIRALDEHRASGVDERGAPVVVSLDAKVSMNMWGFTPRLFERLEAAFVEFLAARGANPEAEFYLPSAVNGLIRRGIAEVEVLDSFDKWLGVTYREDRSAVAAGIAERVERGEYPCPLF